MHYCTGEACTIHPENIELWRILEYTSRQWRCTTVGTALPMGGMLIRPRFYGIDLNVVFTAAGARGMDIDDEFLEKIDTFEAAVLDILNGGGDDGPCTAADRERCIYEMGGEEFMEWKCAGCNRKITGDQHGR